MPVSNKFLTDQIAVVEAQIIAYQLAVDEFASNGAMETYKLDTGQTIQTVTRSDITSLNKMIDSLYNRLSTLCARRDGAASLVGPGW